MRHASRRSFMVLVLISALFAGTNVCALQAAFASINPHDCCKKPSEGKQICCVRQVISHEAVFVNIESPETRADAVPMVLASATESYCGIKSHGGSSPPGEDGEKPSSEKIHTSWSILAPPLLPQPSRP